MHEFQPVGKLVNLCFVIYTVVEVCLATLTFTANRMKAHSAFFLPVSNSSILVKILFC